MIYPRCTLVYRHNDMLCDSIGHECTGSLGIWCVGKGAELLSTG